MRLQARSFACPAVSGNAARCGMSIEQNIMLRLEERNTILEICLKEVSVIARCALTCICGDKLETSTVHLRPVQPSLLADSMSGHVG